MLLNRFASIKMEKRSWISLLACFGVISCIALAANSNDNPAAKDSAKSIAITRVGTQPATKGKAEYFTGAVRVDPLFSANAPSRTSGGSVTFEPGARSAWHTHPVGQILIVTAGRGWVQQWGELVHEMCAGDVIRIPPGVKHWHGATATSAVTHIAIQEAVDGIAVDWLEAVTDEQYQTP